MHPYEMGQTITQRRVDEIVKVRGGSLYHAVERLAQAGLIEAAETERQGRRPERTVYRITEAGREEFVGWLQEALREPQHEYSPFGAALISLHHRPAAIAAQLLAHRALRLAAEVAALDTTLEGLAAQEVSRAHVIEWEYVRAMRQAELAWIRALIDDISRGRLTWDPGLDGSEVAFTDPSAGSRGSRGDDPGGPGNPPDQQCPTSRE